MGILFRTAQDEVPDCLSGCCCLCCPCCRGEDRCCPSCCDLRSCCLSLCCLPPIRLWRLHWLPICPRCLHRLPHRCCHSCCCQEVCRCRCLLRTLRICWTPLRICWTLLICWTLRISLRIQIRRIRMGPLKSRRQTKRNHS